MFDVRRGRENMDDLKKNNFVLEMDPNLQYMAWKKVGD